MSIIAQHGEIFIILACLFGFFMAWGVGANDVANAMGTSVGSRAITIKQAIIIAVIFEFLGAWLAGGEVTATIRGGIIDPELLEADPQFLVYGMLSALLAAAIWLLIASAKGWPVSTTHSIVGAIVGFGAAQKRGGKGVRAATLRDEDYVDTVFTASTHDYILFFTNRGRCYRKKGYLIPEAGRTARGVNIVNFIQVEKDEKVSAMLHVREMDDDSFLVFATRSGTVKRMPLSALRNIRTSGIRALTLDEGDELINVMRTDGSRNILLATHNGQAICFAETDVRPMGREAVGVRGIRLKDGDWVVGAEIAQPDADVLSITENGYGKRTPAADYIRGGEEPQHRGGSGMKNYNITDKTGPVAAVKVVQESDDVLVVSDDGVIIRMEAAGISVLGRATQGVRIMRLSEGARVISVALTDRAESGDAAPAEEPEA